MMQNPKKIVIVCHYYSPHTGGIEMVAQNQAEGLVALGNSVTVVTSKVQRNETSGRVHGVMVRRVRALNILEKRAVPFPIFSPSLLFVMFRAVKRADVVHVHDVFYISSWTAALAARVYRKPLILTQHVDMINHPSALVIGIQKVVYATAGSFIFRSSKKVLVINDRTRRFVVSQGVSEAKIQFCFNGVDTQLFQPSTAAERQKARQKLGLPLDKKIVLFIGRYVPKKGFKKMLAARDAAYQLVFVGGDTPKGAYPGAQFLGILPHRELATVYRAADIFALPSSDEGFPLTLQEAMAGGLPIITSDDAGYASYGLDRKLVCLLKNPTSKSIRAAILRLIKDQAHLRKMATYSRSYAVDTFSLALDVANLDQLYDSVMPRAIASNHFLVTTSWDDSHKLDIRLAELLKKYHLQATFYVAPHNREFNQKDLLTSQEIIKLSRDFEIGSHTITHPRLPYIADNEAKREIVASKAQLERLTGQTIKTFCYPRGEYASYHLRLVKEAGYSYARSVNRHSFQTGDPYEAATTLHAYRHWSDAWGIACFARFNPVKFLHYYLAWDNLAIAMFGRAVSQGGIYHLWGHSWEIDNHNDWERLEKVFAAISGNAKAKYVTNKELV